VIVESADVGVSLTGLRAGVWLRSQAFAFVELWAIFRAIFRLAVQDRVLPSNPAELLFTPRSVTRPSRQVLTAEQVRLLLGQLDLRERLIVQLAFFSRMRPGEILGLQWKHVAEDHVTVVHRVYRGKGKCFLCFLRKTLMTSF
jgi:integrase